MPANYDRRFTTTAAIFCCLLAVIFRQLEAEAFRIPFFSHDDSDIGKSSTGDNTKFIGHKSKKSDSDPAADALGRNVKGYLKEVVDGVESEVNASLPKSTSGANGTLPNQGRGIKRKALCTSCTFLIHSVRWGHRIGFPKGILIDVVRDACIRFSGKTERVCRGIISTFDEDIISLLDKSRASAREICTVFFSVCPARTKDKRFSWDIILPAKQAAKAVLHAVEISEQVIPPPQRFSLIASAPSQNAVKASAPSDANVGAVRMLHLADIHVDLLYKIGSLAVCREPQCCRDDGDPDGDDTKSALSPRAGYWGFNQGFCDTPMQLLDAMLEHIAKKERIDFIIWTGDAVPHDVWNQSRAYQLKITKVVNDAIKRHFPKLPVYPTLGNHESYPVNSFPPASVQGKNNIDWLYNPTAIQWIGWGPDASQRESILKGGYYSHIARPGLKIVSLNTNYCSKLNWWLMLNDDDPAGQMAWLIKELSDSEQKNEAVYIISHISPSGDKWIKPWRDNYYTIVARFKDTIRGTFYGHSHYDEFGVTYDPANLTMPTTVAYIAPSATTYRHLNPAYRIFLLSPPQQKTLPSYTLLDMETYIANLTAANDKAARRQDGKGVAEEDLKWYLEYSAKKQYSLPDMSPKSWSDLATRIKNDPKLFKIYYDNYHKQQEWWTQKTCVGSCKETLLCTMIANACTDGDGILLW